jgi:dTDP-4-amino-4,6-dideoxygalactose transaminase
VRGKLSGDGWYTKQSSTWMESEFQARKVLITHSCTAALEMAALLLDIQPGDEIIMPSFTFVSTANAFVLRGGVPVFVDVKIEDQNIDETKIEAAITTRTRAIVPVHYAGVACEMDSIMEIADRYGLAVIEDAAQAIFATYKGRQLGTIGHLGCFSFHETKNVISGEGGALIINDVKYVDRAEVIREKGTDRSKFFRGQVDKYTWQEAGSSYLPSELNSAFLYAQLQSGRRITSMRQEIWDRYDLLLNGRIGNDALKTPIKSIGGNAHMYQILLESREVLDDVLLKLREDRIQAVTHYVPLHSSPAGHRFGKFSDELEITTEVSSRLLRLPLYAELELDNVDFVASRLLSYLDS